MAKASKQPVGIKFTKNELEIDGIKVLDIVKKHATPFYLYSENTLINNFNEYVVEAKKAGLDALVCFALKSNSNRELVKLLGKAGSGADIVSGGELIRALEAGIHPSKIVFSGVGKTKEEINLALKNNIYSFNVESIEELELINTLAKKHKKIARISLRLNPKVVALTHKHISTGFKTHKFGILKDDIVKAAKNKKLWENASLKGISIHIGSQLTDLTATKEAIKILCETANLLPTPLEFIDVGGGLGVSYNKEEAKAPEVKTYMELVASTINETLNYKVKVVFEPGRRISASSGYFVTSVLRSKTSEDCHFLIVDGGMNDFVRPSLYDAYHEIYPSKNSAKKVKMDIVGPICETADCFAHNRMLPKLKADDFIVIGDTGAYGFTMSSNYNLRSRPSEVLITKNQKLKVINKKQKLEELA